MKQFEAARETPKLPLSAIVALAHFAKSTSLSMA
jgi:hypothetical protein